MEIDLDFIIKPLVKFNVHRLKFKIVLLWEQALMMRVCKGGHARAIMEQSRSHTEFYSLNLLGFFVANLKMENGGMNE